MRIIHDDTTTSTTGGHGPAVSHGLAGDHGPAEGGPAELFERLPSDPSDDDGSAGGEGLAELFDRAPSEPSEGPAEGGSGPTTTSTTGGAGPTEGHGPAEGGTAELFERLPSDPSD